MTTLETIELFALNLVNASSEAAVDALLQPGKSVTAMFVNAHCCNVAARDPSYRWALGRADFLLPDGVGMQLAATARRASFVENLNGTDLFVPLCAQAAKRGMSIFFFGSAEGVAARAATTAQRLSPGLIIAGARHGFFQKIDEDAIIEEINASGAQIVFVALGVPKQDVWIARNRNRLNADLVLGVGAQFDFWSGNIPRAPQFLRRARLEWLMRLAVEPRRMARRYLVGNLEFFWRVFCGQKLTPLPGPKGSYGKRWLDIIVSTIGLVVAAPLIALMAIAIKAESAGPVFFTQIRIGKDGVPFRIFKFRSMYRDAETRRPALLMSSDRDGLCFKSREDPRVTKVGKWLRRFSLDELPQLFNVWRGEMSLVGPRPALLQEVAAYPVAALRRLEVKPGLTGLWQVGGRAEISFDKMIEIDTAYVKSRSLALDFAIIALTARAVISGRGAY